MQSRGLQLILPPLLCGPVEVYLLAHACGSTAIDTALRFDKRLKETHRFAIADTRGRLELTVPIVHPASSSCSWEEIGVSTHGGWWDVHRVALESAYGRTPYFEFYIDRFLPMLTAGVEQRFPAVTDLSAAWDKEIRRILLLPPAEPLREGESGSTMRLNAPCRTLRSDAAAGAGITLTPYWQVRNASLGFIPGLSVLDLIFNLGPEATLYLDSMLPRAEHYINHSLRLES